MSVSKKAGRAGFFMSLVCAGNLARTQTSGANMHCGVSSVNNGSYLAHIGLPHSVGFTVGVRDVLSEDNALSADITLCHLKTPPITAIRYIFLLFFAIFQDANSIIPHHISKSKSFLKIF